MLLRRRRLAVGGSTDTSAPPSIGCLRLRTYARFAAGGMARAQHTRTHATGMKAQERGKRKERGVESTHRKREEIWGAGIWDVVWWSYICGGGFFAFGLTRGAGGRRGGRQQAGSERGARTAES
jgi:hypothetical protein